jgi:Tol biopolymer transport system component
MPEFPEFHRRVARLIAEPPVEPTPVSALHERARRIRRRRRTSVAVLVLVAAVAVVVGVWPRRSRSTLVQVGPPPSPTVAYVAADGVHVTGDTRVLAGPGATRPRWSPDGAWIAYQDRSNALWVVRPDGRAAHKIEDKAHRWDWAPRGVRIAVVHGNSSQLTVVDAERGERWSPPGRVDDFTWSADGSRVAYSVLIAPRAGGWVDDVFVARLGTPARPRCLPVPCPDIHQVEVHIGGRDVDTTVDVGVFFAGWSPDGSTLLVWPDENHSSSIAMDGLPLHELSADGGTTRPLTRTLVRRDWIAWSPDGRRLLTVESGGRMRGDSPRRIVECAVAAASCRAVADNAIDPAWSSDAGRISFVQVAEHPPNNPDDWASQYAHRTLVVVASDGTRRADVPATSGAASPRWLDNGNILLVRDGGLSIVDPTTGRRNELVHTIGLGNDDVPPPNAYEATDLVGYAWTNAFAVAPASP